MSTPDLLAPHIARTILPGVEAMEPDLTVSPSGGTVLVTAPALQRTDQELPLQGGAAWVSHDGGRRFNLTLDPTNRTSTPRTILRTCSCDTAGTLDGKDLYVATLVWATSVTNAEDTISIMRSTDGGATWRQTTPEANLDPPNQGPVGADRPWLTPGPHGALDLIYGTDVTPSNPTGGWTTFLDRSTDGGRTWQNDSVVWQAGAGALLAMKPRYVYRTSLLVPIEHVRYTGGSPGNETDTIVLARSDDDGASFRRVNVSGPFVDQAGVLGFGMDANSAGDVALTWAGTALHSNASWLHARVSDDLGTTWGPIANVTVPGTAVQPNVALGPNGTIAIAYYGSNSTAPVVHQGKDTDWTARVALLDANLTLRRVLDVSPHPVYQGRYCSPPCTDSSFRSPLGDFLSVAWTRNGTLLVAYTDRSVHHEGRRGGDLVVARVEDAANLAPSVSGRRTR